MISILFRLFFGSLLLIISALLFILIWDITLISWLVIGKASLSILLITFTIAFLVLIFQPKKGYTKGNIAHKKE